MVVLSNKEISQMMSGEEENGMKGKGLQVFSHSDVHVYFIDPKQEGATKRDTTTLRLVMIPKKDQDLNSHVVVPPAFLEAGGWFYPLIPSKTPVYRTQENYYVFPNLLSTTPGASVGIVFPPGIRAEKKELFEDILLDSAGLKEFPSGFAEKFGNPGGLITTNEGMNGANGHHPMENESSPKSIAGKVGDDIMNVAEMAADGISTAAHKTLQFMGYEKDQEEAYFKSDTPKDYSEQVKYQLNSNVGTPEDRAKKVEAHLNSDFQTAFHNYGEQAKHELTSGVEKSKDYAGQAESQINSAMETAKDYGDQAKYELSSGVEKSKDYTGQVQSQVNSSFDTAIDCAGQAASQFNSNFERAKDYATQAKYQLSENIEKSKDYAGDAVEISGHAVNKLSDATINLGSYSKSLASSTMDTVHYETLKGSTAISDGVAAATLGAMHTLEVIYEALHNAGKNLANAITNNHVLDHKYEDGKLHIKELYADAVEKVNEHIPTPEQTDKDLEEILKYDGME